jgi:hypothetical protein
MRATDLPCRRQHVVHRRVARQLQVAGPQVERDAAHVQQGQPAGGERRTGLGRRHEAAPLVGAARQQAQDILRRDDGIGEALDRAVDGGQDHQPARLHQFGAACQEGARIGDMLHHLHCQHDVEPFPGVRQRLGGGAAVVDRQARLIGVPAGHGDVACSGLDPHHVGAEPRQRLAQHARAAADVEDAQALQAVGAELPAPGAPDIVEPHGIVAMQPARLAIGVPPGRRRGIEAGDLGAVDGGCIWMLHSPSDERFSLRSIDHLAPFGNHAGEWPLHGFS